MVLRPPGRLASLQLRRLVTEQIGVAASFGEQLLVTKRPATKSAPAKRSAPSSSTAVRAQLLTCPCASSADTPLRIGADTTLRKSADTSSAFPMTSGLRVTPPAGQCLERARSGLPDH